MVYVFSDYCSVFAYVTFVMLCSIFNCLVFRDHHFDAYVLPIDVYVYRVVS